MRHALAAAAVALLAFSPERSLRAPVVRAAVIEEVLPPMAIDSPNAVHTRFVLGNGHDVRALVANNAYVWAATSGGVDRYDATTHERRHFGVESGLDTLDARDVQLASRVTVWTAESRCVLDDTHAHFRCARATPPPPSAPRLETFAGAPVVARLAIGAGAFVGTRGRGLWFADRADETHATRLDPSEGAPASFVRKVVFYDHRAWVGTFDDGLLTIDAEDAAKLAEHPELFGTARASGAPMRMVNDLAVIGSALFIASNEGLFHTRDGKTFDRVDAVTRNVTGLAVDRDRLLATTTAALWRIRDARRPLVEANWWRPAGSRSLQAVTTSNDMIYIASEDRGVIAFDGRVFTAHDKLAGLPTSWVVALASDTRGGTFAATLRDGVFHLDRDGHFQIVRGAPSEWTLDASVDHGHLCVGTQAGAACWDDPMRAPTRTFAGLPDGRVHDVQSLGSTLFFGTEAGIATAT